MLAEEPLQLVDVGQSKTAVTVKGLSAQLLVKDVPILGIPRNSSIAMEQALAWSEALSIPPEFRSTATRAAF